MPIVHKASTIEPPLQSAPWAELPVEITMDILQRLGMIEIVESAQRVCSTWWKVCHDPAMWRVINLKYDPNSDMRGVLNKICRIAVDRSQGQLLKISIGSKDLLNYIADRSSQLRHLRLVNCGNVAGGLVSAAKNFPLLEELHAHLTFITAEDIESVGQSVGRYCPLLNSFTLNASEYDTPVNLISADDGQALDIAKSMPELRHLALIANTLTNVGLEAILDGCPHLLSLDLRCCYNIDLEGDLGKRCREQIVDRKQPCASCQDYEFYSEFSHYCFSNDDSTFRD
ncbi:putative F-box/LRR-repeat protein 23 [Solanum pennellii]|uniref:F-box/LRR-repeat protein 23 n=1 Tax=Solanum pennellii TaxID=28526 RepID=A0ABM1HCX6_SOLPN|nr:putative F-box/LRR-repeat protein 23 [Solanum pennellii]